MNNTIDISPINVWNGNSVLAATKFEVRHVTYSNGSAAASCHLFNVEVVDGTEKYTEVAARVVTATKEQCDSWTDDLAFYKILAQNAGLTPAP